MVPNLMRKIPDTKVERIVAERVAVLGARRARRAKIRGRSGDSGSKTHPARAASALGRSGVMVDRAGRLGSRHSGDEEYCLGECSVVVQSRVGIELR